MLNSAGQLTDESFDESSHHQNLVPLLRGGYWTAFNANKPANPLLFIANAHQNAPQSHVYFRRMRQDFRPAHTPGFRTTAARIPHTNARRRGVYTTAG